MAAHRPQPLVSLSVMEVLPGPAEHMEASYDIQSCGTLGLLPVTQGGQGELPPILSIGMGAASLMRAQKSEGFSHHLLAGTSRQKSWTRLKVCHS